MEERYGYVYKITNIVNNKIYVGKRVATTFDDQYWGGGKIIHSALKKYGKDNFTRDILEWCSSKEHLEERERFWIAELNARDLTIGYNIAEGGEGGITYVGENPQKGRKRNITLESHERMSAAHKGIPLREETKLKQSKSHTLYWETHPEQREYYSRYFSEHNSWRGKHHLPETVETISEKNKGKEPWNKGKTDCYSPEVRYAMGSSMRGKDPWNKGKIGCYSEETIEQLRISHTGKKQSAETIQKRVDKLRGRKHTDESRLLMSQKLTGKKRTEEQRLKQKERLKTAQYRTTCRICGVEFISHCCASKYCESCKMEKK